MLRGYIGTRPVNPTKGVLTLAEHREWVARGTVIVIGVQHKGTGTTDGWDLRQVSLLGDVNDGAYVREITRTSEYFDTHPSYQFNDWTDAAGNVFCEVPRAYWWRGMLPDAIDGTTPRWTMLLSPNQIPGFAASPGAFKRAGVWLDKFYYGKYRGYNAGDNKVGSQPGKTAWGNVTFNDFRTYCANNGEGYHMTSLFEWHEILGRMVIERCTFQLMPANVRSDQSVCIYRGINDFCFSGTVQSEWMDGIRTSSSTFEVWDEADGIYQSIGTRPSRYYIMSLNTAGNLNFLFIPNVTNSSSTACMIPNYASGDSGYVCYAYFDSGLVYSGAFYSNFHGNPSYGSSNLGCRLAKW